MVSAGIHLRWKIRVMITGYRNLKRRDVVNLWMARMTRRAEQHGFTPAQILWGVGDCPTGADLFAWEWMQAQNVFFERFEADWERHGRMGGPIRNNQMISEIRPTHTLAFMHPDARGTVGCADRAQQFGEVTRIYSPAIWTTHKAGSQLPKKFDWSKVDETL